MPQIIRPGKLPQEEVYEVTCPNCKTLFSFERGEADYIQDQRDGNALVIHCPLPGCGQRCSVDLRRR